MGFCSDVEDKPVFQITHPRKAVVPRPAVLRWAGALTGAALLASAAMKSRQYARLPTVPHGLWGAPAAEPALVAFEIFLGLWLISGAFPAAARRVAIGCFGTFACYTLYEALIGKADCGCFGRVHVNPWFTFVLDTTMVLALRFLARPKGHDNPSQSNRRRHAWPVAVALAVGLAAGIITAVLYPKPVAAADGLFTADGGKLVILEPHHWIGHRLPVLADIISAVLSRSQTARLQRAGDHLQDADATVAARLHKMPLDQRLAHGQWLVMFYHASCEECRHTIPIYEALAQHEFLAGGKPHVAFIRVPSVPPNPVPPGLFDSRLALHGTLNSGHEWFATTPIVVELRHGAVVRAVSGDAAMNLNWRDAMTTGH
jgi:hypothetical protein